MRPFLFTPLLVLAALPALATERWETLPPNMRKTFQSRTG
jgi:hypothetical protein